MGPPASAGEGPKPESSNIDEKGLNSFKNAKLYNDLKNLHVHTSLKEALSPRVTRKQKISTVKTSPIERPHNMQSPVQKKPSQKLKAQNQVHQSANNQDGKQMVVKVQASRNHGKAEIPAGKTSRLSYTSMER